MLSCFYLHANDQPNAFTILSIEYKNMHLILKIAIVLCLINLSNTISYAYKDTLNMEGNDTIQSIFALNSQSVIIKTQKYFTIYNLTTQQIISKTLLTDPLIQYYFSDLYTFYAINTDSIKIFSNLPSNNSLSNLCQKEMLDDLPLNISNIRAVSRNGNYILLSEPSILNIYNTDLRNYQYSVPNQINSKICTIDSSGQFVAKTIDTNIVQVLKNGVRILRVTIGATVTGLNLISNQYIIIILGNTFFSNPLTIRGNQFHEIVISQDEIPRMNIQADLFLFAFSINRLAQGYLQSEFQMMESHPNPNSQRIILSRLGINAKMLSISTDENLYVLTSNNSIARWIQSECPVSQHNLNGVCACSDRSDIINGICTCPKGSFDNGESCIDCKFTCEECQDQNLISEYYN